MHDVFHLHDLANDAQHRLLLYWLDVARRDRSVPLAAFDEMRLPPSVRANYVVLGLGNDGIRKARFLRTGSAVPVNLGVDPVGLTLEQLMPPSYVNDIVPAYAICASTFSPLSSLDLVTYSDGYSKLVRRLVLPIGRTAGLGGTCAQYLLMIYAPAGGADDMADEVPGPGQCRTMQRVDSVGIALFKDVPPEPAAPCSNDIGL
ncbi:MULTISPECIES: hypothetical protein [unclassified Azospirillum]|uniref:hypothetical protein n=1 Tax=unclassified Azospirillum TaxID=2630922 RepID=UPI000B65F5D9|nr:MULTISPECIES: hypothetical protein [unclassified Azospirillum]SNS60986.1 hypothetical protein SAMN05880556_10845 [Azospirillum sp. RU38E]SNS80334.1 hypothetical protein SAMN05880591_10845 [Azospirillum sp. RU37A]